MPFRDKEEKSLQVLTDTFQNPHEIGLPSHLITAKSVELAWQGDKTLGLLLFYPVNMPGFERAYGEGMTRHVYFVMHGALKDCCREYLAKADLVSTEFLEDGSLIAVFRQEDLDLKTLADLALTIRLNLRRALNKEMVKLTGQKLDIRTGYSSLRAREGLDSGHTLYQALCDAREVASGTLNISKL